MNFLTLFYEDLCLEDKGVPKIKIDETNHLLNMFLSSIKEDQSLHQCILEESIFKLLHKPYSFIFRKREESLCSEKSMSQHISPLLDLSELWQLWQMRILYGLKV